MKDNLSYENMDECFRQGISWGCDKECPVYKRGECELQDEVRMSLESETMEEIKVAEIWKDIERLRGILSNFKLWENKKFEKKLQLLLR